jgi:excisionase family DNA binding protein
MRIYTLQEVAKILRMGVKKTAEHVKKGRIPGYLGGVPYQFDAEAIDAWLRSPQGWKH